MQKRFIGLLLSCLLCLGVALPALGEAEYEKYTTRFFGTFDTIITVSGYAQDEAAFTRIAAGAEALFQHYHRIFDAYSLYDGVQNLYVLNRDGASGPVKVEPELLELLLYCREMQPLTNGTFNVALGAVLSLWRDAREAAEENPNDAAIPDINALKAAAEHVNFDDVIIDEEAGTVAFADPLLRLDVGAVAKGYATERVAEAMLAGEMPSFLLSAGGNVRLGNPPMDGRQRWGVGIQDPDVLAIGDTGSQMLDTLFTADTSVVTSGDYQRYFVVDGVRYHHIISPETLMPSDYYRSVTVICEDSGWADVLSTALYLMPYEEGRAFVDAQEGVEAYWMLADGTTWMTDGAMAMAKSQGASARD